MKRLTKLSLACLAVLACYLYVKSVDAQQEGNRDNGFGKGNQDKGQNKRLQRQTRWTINVPRDSADAFVKKLAEIKVFLMIPEGDSVARFLRCDDLGKKPVEWKPTDQKDINATNRIWFMSHDKQDGELIAKGLGLKDAPRWFAIFIPQDLEKEMVLQEFNHQKLPEDEINAKKWVTTFDVNRNGENLEVKVRYQGPKQQGNIPEETAKSGQQGQLKDPMDFDPRKSGAPANNKPNQPEQSKEVVDFDPTKPPAVFPSNKRELRQRRWTIVVPREDEDLFFKKIVSLKAFLVIPEGDPAKKYFICDNLEKQPPQWKVTDLKEINAHRRLWYISRDNKDCNFIAKVCSLNDTPAWIAIFLPPALEEEMARQELAHKQQTEDQLNTMNWITIFDVDRRGDAWDVRVRYQGLRKK